MGEVHLVQVDERVAPPGDPDRNLTHLRESLLTRVALAPERLHAMPVEASDLRRRLLTLPTPGLSRSSLARHRCLTSSTWDWGLTATRPRLCPEILSSVLPRLTSRLLDSTTGGAG